MEVEGPESPIRSVRDFIVHIATVTLGILIALGLEGLIEARRDQHLVMHAETDFRAEFSRNRAAIANDASDARAVRTELEGLIDFEQAKLGNRAEAVPALPNFRKFTRVQTTAWETAVATQALLHIPFGEAGALSRAQQAQQTFNGLQDRAEAQWFEIAAYGDARTLSKSRLPEAIQKLTIAYAYLVSIQSAQVHLIEAYDVALKALPPAQGSPAN